MVALGKKYIVDLGPNREARVAIIGHEPRISENPSFTLDRVVQLGGKRDTAALLTVASNHDAPGYGTIVHDTLNKVMQADGVVLSEQQTTGVLQTADCAALALYDARTKKAVLAHAGRPALTPKGCPSCTIVHTALTHLVGSTGSKDQVHAVVIGNICGACFKHENAMHLVEHFMKYPDWVFHDKETGALDLFQVIRHELMFYGVPDVHIRHFGTCTLEDENFSSHRRGDTDRNTVMLLR